MISKKQFSSIFVDFDVFGRLQVKAAESISNILRHNIKPGVAYQVGWSGLSICNLFCGTFDQELIYCGSIQVLSNPEFLAEGTAVKVSDEDKSQVIITKDAHLCDM